MHISVRSVALLSALQAAGPAYAARCNANNCLRAVRASAFPTRPGAADCSSFFSVTVLEEATVTNTIIPTDVPAYASACSGIERYSSACSCIGVTQTTVTVTAGQTETFTTTETSSTESSTATETSTTETSSTSTSTTSTETPTDKPTPTANFVVVSPAACPPTSPVGELITESDVEFADRFPGTSYQEYVNAQFIFQDGDVGPIFLDLSNPDFITIADSEGFTLVLHFDGSFEAYAGDCELGFAGQIDLSQLGIGKRDVLWERTALAQRQSATFCSNVQLYCNSRVGLFLNGAIGSVLCTFVGAQIGADIGGAIGFLGNALGPAVGIPTTLLGVFLGGRLGAFVAGRIGAGLCGGVTSLLGDKICKACLRDVPCGPGEISCGGGPCMDALSDAQNCGACGVVCPSGSVCRNGQCSAPECNGSVCGSLSSCGGDCFCFSAAESTGFCGPNTSCSPLAGCVTNADCSLGDICAVGTCCRRNVCLPSCGSIGRRALEIGAVNETELFTAGTNPFI